MIEEVNPDLVVVEVTTTHLDGSQRTFKGRGRATKHLGSRVGEWPQLEYVTINLQLEESQ